MSQLDRRRFLAGAVALGLAAGPSCSRGEAFECPPCGCASDGDRFAAPGSCPACDMTLRPTRRVDLGHVPMQLSFGAGHFTLPGREGRATDRITVHYYLPEGLTADAPIVLIVPGSGRNADEQRNVWIEYAIDAGALVAALGYPEAAYPFTDYQLAGLAQPMDQRDIEIERRPESTIVRVSEEQFRADFVDDAKRWLFADFDRAFEHLVGATGLMRQTYDLFGHSAGGQILHRLALFQPSLKASRLIAANAGFYTMPDLSTPFPAGLGGTGLTDDNLARAFDANLTLLLGERDNDDDAGGTLLHTPAVDRYGSGRLDRGKAFFAAARDEASRLGVALRWQLVIAPNLGHDHRHASQIAARHLGTGGR